MKAWELDRIPYLGFRAFTAILQSITQAVLGNRKPLFLSARLPLEFAQTCWQNMGCRAEDLTEITRQFNAMFTLTLPPPALDAQAGELSQTGLTLWRQGDKNVTFFTSGSTAQPKACTHKEDDLRQEITSIAPLVADRQSLLVTAPLHHMYGFTFGLLLPLALDIPIRSVPPLPTIVTAQMQPGDVVVGIPLLWTRLIESDCWPPETTPGHNITIFTATSPTPTATLEALHQKGFRTIEFFGASEMGVVCYREKAAAAFTLLPHVQRADHGNSESALERLLPCGMQASYPLLDAVRWTGARTFFPGQRHDKAVQVASINVYPDFVRKILEEHEGVSQCSIRLMRPDEGYKLKAFIVPQHGWDAQSLRPALAAFTRSRLSVAQRPGSYTFGPDIPRGPLGKPKDW